MPEYSYRCKKCGVFRDLNTISNRATTVCECGAVAKRDTEAEMIHGRGRRCKQVTTNERWSRSMGVPPASLAAYRKRFPNSVYRDDGLLLNKGRKHKLQQAKERDMVELDDGTSKAWFR
jgi:putative FmdB family regulatory protein